MIEIMGIIFIIVISLTIGFLFWYHYTSYKGHLIKGSKLRETMDEVIEKNILIPVKVIDTKLDEIKIQIINEEKSVTIPSKEETKVKDGNIYIYILKLVEDKYYIGKSKNPLKRCLQHLEGNGSEWTKLYKPIGLVSILPYEHIFDEDKYTLEYMLLYGIENVRGGNYVQVELEQSQITYIKKLFDGVKDKCYKCGSDSHFIKDCSTDTLTKETCYKCGSDSHFIKDCSAGTLTKETCYKCGEIGHFANSCKAIKYHTS